MTRFVTDRAARMRAGDDRGFALIFVLFVTTVVMIGTATTLAVTTGGILPSKQNQDNAAALSAAQAGVQRMLSTLDASCPSGNIEQCPQIATLAASSISGVIASQQYKVTVVNPGDGTRGHGYLSADNKGALIVRSTGVSPVTANGVAASNAVTRVVTATVSSKPSPLSLAYVSNYETVGSTFLNSYFGPRKIVLTDSLNDPVLSAVGGLSASATVSWSGVQLAQPSGLGDNICDKLWYDDPSNVNDGDTGIAGRSSLKSARTALPIGTDYAESGTLNPLVGSTTAVTRYAPCETTFTSGQNFKGSVYSRDAFYLSNETTGGTGPTFSVPQGEVQYPALWTGWQSTSSPAADVANPYRSFPVVGGSPSAVSGAYRYTRSSSPYSGLSLPSSTGITAGTCTFTGPTRIALSGSTAQVTSPGTSNPGASCKYTPSGGGYSVPISTTTLYVQDGTSSLSPSAMNSVINPPTGDITYYSKSAGDAYLSGTLDSGKLSLVTTDDIIVTGNTGATSTATTRTNAGNEPSWSSANAAVDLVATNDVRVYHPVTCLGAGSATYGANASLTPSGSAPNGWCPNDITGLYTTPQSNEVIRSNGDLRPVHPSLQYTSLSPNAEPTSINAAVFALNGSLYADNFDRGTELGALTVTGGVYENHHGLLGEQWATPTGSSNRHYSGFKLKINYLDYSNAGLGYVPELSGGNDLEPWQVVNVVSGGPTS